MSPSGLAVCADNDETVSAAVAALGYGAEGLVFAATAEPADWAAAEDRLAAAFRRTAAAAKAGVPVVYLVRGEDLSGSRGPLAAAVACALLSFARALAMERARAGQVANVLSFAAETEAERIAASLRFLLDPGAPSGELLELGIDHFGRTRP